jgi:AraC-like DNA-binding protein
LPTEPEQHVETPEAEETSDQIESTASSRFLARFKEVVEARMSDSEVSVEDLAADMNLSRVQLYRKIKAITDSSPVELLRTARLKRAYQLLVTTDKNISEVAYDVGFTAPSYFTKCFKDEFGISPSDL